MRGLFWGFEKKQRAIFEIQMNITIENELVQGKHHWDKMPTLKGWFVSAWGKASGGTGDAVLKSLENHFDKVSLAVLEELQNYLRNVVRRLGSALYFASGCCIPRVTWNQ